MVMIVQPTTATHIENMIALSTEYVNWMVDVIKQEYPDVDTKPFLQGHAYDDVRARFSEEYAPPNGSLFIAIDGNEICGCAALTKWQGTICEIQTLFVRPQFRRIGVARKLVTEVITVAQTMGYNTVRLDTLAFMVEAQTLYQSFGFYPIERYRDGAGDIQKHILYFERKL